MKRSWLAADSGERNVEYELVSTVVHHGKAISSGHYTADVRQPDDRWAMRVGQGRSRCLGRAGVVACQACSLLKSERFSLSGVVVILACSRCKPAPCFCSWLRFDDGHVFQVKQQDVLTNRPYLLFYQRVV